MNATYEERRLEFGAAYEDFEGEDVLKLIVEAGQRLEAICLDDDAVDVAMAGLHAAMVDSRGSPSGDTVERSWRALWESTGINDSACLPLAQKFTSLNAYAYFGLSPVGDDEPCTIDDVKHCVRIVREALAAAKADPQNLPQTGKTLLAAEARLALDEGNGIAPEGLAALTRIGIKSLRNALAPSSGSGLEIHDGKVTPESALAWLLARGDFKDSLWRAGLAETSGDEGVRSVQGELLWVPFAKDEKLFDPQRCLRAGKYTIGPKSAECSVESYREALSQLARMRPAPYWRRPNSAGNWGIVTGIGFRPCTLQELGLDDAGAVT